MATLAQTMLDRGIDRSSLFDTNELESRVHDMLLGTLSSDMARYTLTFDPAQAFISIISNNKELEMLAQFARLPINPMWLEFILDEKTVQAAIKACPNIPREQHVRRCGFLLYDREDNPFVIQGCELHAGIVPVYETFSGNIMPFCVYGINNFSYKHNVGLLRQTGMRWGNPTWYDGSSLDDRQQDAINNITFVVEMALTLLNMPRLITKNEHTPSPKVLKHRNKGGKPPIVSHTVITLNIGPRYSTGQSHAGTGTPRRYHMVTGHIRTLTKGREKPLTTWVPEHARGNIKLGQVIAKERNVKMKGK